RLKTLDDKITQVKDNEEESSSRVKANNEAWARMGIVSKAIGRPDSLLDQQGEALLQQYIYRTRIEALIFAKQLLQEFITELTDLKNEVDKAASTIADAVKKYKDRIAERVTDNGGPDLRQQLVRFYRPDQVRTITQNLVKNEAEQRKCTNSVRKSLIGLL